MLLTMLSNVWTTLSGAVLAALNQTVNGPGFKIPTNKTEWGQTAVSLVTLIFGIVMKDATTGSKPS